MKATSILSAVVAATGFLASTVVAQTSLPAIEIKVIPQRLPRKVCSDQFSGFQIFLQQQRHSIVSHLIIFESISRLIVT